jgi:hypothetical protein
MARTQYLRHPEALTDRGIARITHFHLEPVGLKMLDPQLATTAVGVFPHLNCVDLRQRSTVKCPNSRQAQQS